MIAYMFADPDEDDLVLWVIYEKPVDHPHHFVVRRWTMNRNTHRFVAGDTCYLAETLDVARSIVPRGLHRSPKQSFDQRRVVEVWV